MAVKDNNYNPIKELENKISKQCDIIRIYEEIMTQFSEYIKEEHSVEEYKEFINSHIWYQIME